MIIKRALQQTRYLAWKLFHPGQPFSNFYVDMVSRKLEAGRPHTTLGTCYRDEAYFRTSGEKQLLFLKKQGLQPDHTCIDYGCGSLRLGHHLIPYLEPGHYIGADITDRFYQEGLTVLDQELIDSKKPTFSLISPANMDGLRIIGADFIVSTGVIIHIPVDEIALFLKNILFIMKEETQTFITFYETEKCNRTSIATWSYPGALLQEKAENLGARAEILSDPNIDDLRRGHGDTPYKILKICKN